MSTCKWYMLCNEYADYFSEYKYCFTLIRIYKQRKIWSTNGNFHWSQSTQTNVPTYHFVSFAFIKSTLFEKQSKIETDKLLNGSQCHSTASKWRVIILIVNLFFPIRLNDQCYRTLLSSLRATLISISTIENQHIHTMLCLHKRSLCIYYLCSNRNISCTLPSSKHWLPASSWPFVIRGS